MTKTTKYLLVALALSTLIPGLSIAQEPKDAPQQLAETLLDLTDSKATLESALASQIPTIQTSIKAVLEPLGKEKATKCQSLVMREVNRIFTWGNLKPSVVSAYTSTYTPEELQSLIDFYSSPTGRMFTSKAPVVNQKITASIGKLIDPYRQSLQNTLIQCAGGE